MKYQYQTEGTCSKFIEFDIAEDQTLHNVVFTEGAAGTFRVSANWWKECPSARSSGN